MEAHFPGQAPAGTGETEQKGGKGPVRQRSRAPLQQGSGEVVEGPLIALAPGAFAPRSLGVRAPLAKVVALAPGTLQGTIFPPEHMEVGVALVGVEAVVHMGAHRHGCASPGVGKPVLPLGDSHMCRPGLRSYKSREIERRNL